MFDVVDAGLDERVNDAMGEGVDGDPRPSLVHGGNRIVQDGPVPQRHEVGVGTAAAIDPISDDLHPAIGGVRHRCKHLGQLVLILNVKRQVAHVPLRARNMAAAADQVKPGCPRRRRVIDRHATVAYDGDSARERYPSLLHHLRLGHRTGLRVADVAVRIHHAGHDESHR